jgi:hypothetical protein
MKVKILHRVFLFFLLLITWLDLDKFNIIPVSKIGSPIPVVPQIQIDLLQAQNQGLINDAVRETSKLLLQYLVPQDCKEAWQTNFLFADLLADNTPEVVFSFSLPPEKGLLAVLQKEGSFYFLIFYRDNLFPIAKLESLPLKNGQSFLVTKENHQERLGAFCELSTVTLWKWQKNKLHEIFAENSFWDISWLNTWQDPSATPPKWLNLKQALTITYRGEEKILLQIKGQQQFSEAPAPQNTSLPAEYQFEARQSRQIIQEYYWDEQWQNFILRTGFYLPPGEEKPQEIAILKDLELHLESLAIQKSPCYLIIDKQGHTFSLPKNELLN